MVSSTYTLKAWRRGCHRARRPDETLSAVQPFLRRAGITRVADVTGLDYPGIPTVMVIRPNGRSLSVTQGKGMTLEMAKVSAIMEAIEHDHAESIDTPLVLGRIGKLTGRICDLARLPSFPRRFGQLTGDSRLLWVDADDIASSRTRLVPFEMVHLDLTVPLPEGTGHFPVSSNGLASGNTLLEATLHGLYELIERDARTLFFVSSKAEQRARRVALDTVNDDDCRAVLDRFNEAGLLVALWDLTTDIGVATLLAAVLERQDNAFRRVPLAYGSGAHGDRNIALLRALTEAAQSRLTNIVGARDDTLPQFLEHARSEDRQMHYREEFNAGAQQSRSFESCPHTKFDYFEQDLAALLDALDRCGLNQVLRVDLSRPEWPVHVARMIVPGLEAHIDIQEYCPGPRALGVRARP